MLLWLKIYLHNLSLRLAWLPHLRVSWADNGLLPFLAKMQMDFAQSEIWQKLSNFACQSFPSVVLLQQKRLKAMWWSLLPGCESGIESLQSDRLICFEKKKKNQKMNVVVVDTM